MKCINLECNNQSFAKNLCKPCYQRKWYKNNQEKMKKWEKDWYQKNKKHVIERVKDWKKNNLDKVKSIDQNRDKGKLVAYFQNRYETDVNYRIKIILRNRLRSAIKNNQKSGSAISDLGCSIEEFKIYIESKFLPGMSWDNHGLKTWHLDHVIALDNFDLNDYEQLKKACHYTNIQPMWALENIKKSNKLSITKMDNGVYK